MTISGARVREGGRISLQDIAKSCEVQCDTPGKKKLVQCAQTFRQKALYFKRKLILARRRGIQLSKLASARFVDMVDELAVSPMAKQILNGELANFKKKPNGRTWLLKDKLFCLAILKRSVKAYRFLRSYLTLPSESSLHILLQKVFLNVGVSKTLLSLLKTKVLKMISADKYCCVSFDEIYLRANLCYNSHFNVVEGFEDYGHRGRTNRIADHALVFMCQGLHSKWTFPVAYFFVSQTCPAPMLKLLISDVIKSLCSIGLNVCGTISDQGPNNRGAISELRREGGDDILYFVNGKSYVHVWDMPHILKNVRNNLMSSDLCLGNGTVAKWC
ncbi:hypothetical protein ONE63_006699 [Megalurothrips usitatus]|uniref:Transposable element P transposase-like RNase H domain-containing protein n=1 Tax=Megalurothrips usitatus TaxID=439358 RepID=A0AAV7XY62_9NEOP|nr:hypothetical protein ONE63_006699 [Megalurothrips usitatus]